MGKPRIVHQAIPSMDVALGGVTIETKKLEDGNYRAFTPNYPNLKPVEADNSVDAVRSFERRILAYMASGMDEEKANEADCSLTSRHPLTCG